MADTISVADIPDTFQVAVTVFATANGTDYQDAADRVIQALRRVTRKPLPLPHRASDVEDAFIDVVEVIEAGTAARNGFLTVRPFNLAWRQYA